MKKLAFLLILFLTILLRIQYLDKALMADETGFFEAAENINLQGTPIFCNYCLTEDPGIPKLLKIHNVHTPLFLVYLAGVVHLFHLNEFFIRFSITIFSIASVLLIYFIGKMLGGQKVGLVSMFLLAISALHVEYSQMVDIDGSLFTFFILLTIFSFFKWQKLKNTKYLILFISSFVTSLLTKEITIFLFPVLFFYFLKEKKTFTFFKISIITLVVSLTFLFLFNILLSTNFFEGILSFSTNFIIHRFRTNLWNRVYQFLGITTWKFTPPLLLLIIPSIFYNWKKASQFYKFLIYFLLSFSIFYTLILGVTRYFVPIVPIICLLLANYITNYKIRYTQKTFLIISITAVLCFTVFYFFRIRTDVLFLNNIKNNFWFISIPFWLCVIPISLQFTKHRNIGFVILIGMLIGYNIFFAQETINPLITPDFNKAVKDAVKFIENSSIEGPVVTMHDISFYSKKDFYYIEFLFTAEELDSLIKEGKIEYVIYRTNSLVIQPSINQYLESNCKIVGNSFSKNVEIFRAYKC